MKGKSILTSVCSLKAIIFQIPDKEAKSYFWLVYSQGSILSSSFFELVSPLDPFYVPNLALPSLPPFLISNICYFAAF